MRDCVVELVGLEPATRVLWNAVVSDQLTLSNTRYLAAYPVWSWEAATTGAEGRSSRKRRRWLGGRKLPSCGDTGDFPGVTAANRPLTRWIHLGEFTALKVHHAPLEGSPSTYS